MKRYGSVVEVKKSHLAEYKRLHANAWPEVLQKITECNIRNYSIFLRRLPDSKLYLFSYFEYVGGDFDADMQAIADDPKTQEWWVVCKPCLQPLPGVGLEECWASMEEVFHHD